MDYKYYIDAAIQQWKSLKLNDAHIAETYLKSEIASMMGHLKEIQHYDVYSRSYRDYVSREICKCLRQLLRNARKERI